MLSLSATRTGLTGRSFTKHNRKMYTNLVCQSITDEGSLAYASHMLAHSSTDTYIHIQDEIERGSEWGSLNYIMYIIIE